MKKDILVSGTKEDPITIDLCFSELNTRNSTLFVAFVL